MVRALASHQGGLGSIPRPGVICGLSLLLVLSLLQEVFLRVLRFPLSLKTSIPKFQLNQESEGHPNKPSVSMAPPSMSLFIHSVCLSVRSFFCLFVFLFNRSHRRLWLCTTVYDFCSTRVPHAAKRTWDNRKQTLYHINRFLISKIVLQWLRDQTSLCFCIVGGH